MAAPNRRAAKRRLRSAQLSAFSGQQSAPTPPLSRGVGPELIAES
jgi:hypothetical protein